MNPGGRDEEVLKELAIRAMWDVDHAGWYVAKAYWLGRGEISPEQALLFPPGAPELRIIDNETESHPSVNPDAERLQVVEQPGAISSNDPDSLG